MKRALVRNAASSILIASGLSLGWLTVAVLPIALYQYFEISLPEVLVDVQTAAWSAYWAPLSLLRWAPAFSSVDPLITLIPSFALLFALWCVVLFTIVFGWKQWRRAA
jgi:hypothetical protein